jgi:hypothetical protein
MAEHESEFEQNLRQVGQRLRAGLAKLYPVTEKRLKTVRETARRQWELKQQRQKDKSTGHSADQSNKTSGKQQNDQDKDYGHSH